MRRARAPLAALAAIGLGLGTGACARAPAHAVDGRLRLSVREFSLSPASAQLRPGRLTLAVRNDGVLPHRIAIGRGRSALAIGSTLAPGRQGELSARLPRGEYRVFCTLSNHDTLGLYGSVTVR